MTELEKAAKQALEALEYYEKAGLSTISVVKSITALRRALEQPAQQEPGFYGRAAARLSKRVKELEARETAQQEPVAWIEHEWSGTGLRHLHFERREPTVRDEVVCPVWTPLYTRPQEREPLTDEQIADIRIDEEFDQWGISEAAFRYVARAIEAKLREKNT